MQPADLATARQQYLAARAAGHSGQAAVATSGLPVKRAAAYTSKPAFAWPAPSPSPPSRPGYLVARIGRGAAAQAPHRKGEKQ